MDIDQTSASNTNSFLPLKKRVRPSFDDLTKRNKKPMSSSNFAKYKGVVQQHNGHWGAQIYVDHKRIWLGTFKSADEAALAYDSASTKLRTLDATSHRNFPLSDFTLHEPEFQQGYTTEAVLDMIRDSSYFNKLRDFLKIRSKIVDSNTKKVVEEEDCNNKGFACNQLFQKELTPSDVGKLNRLVIPKKYAVKHLPFLSDGHNERDEGDEEIVFYDRAMRQWKFRYCYWKSSQSFVFTRGWNSFVKEKNLKEKDVIVFYTCDVPKTLELGQSKNLLMIDVHYCSENGLLVREEVKENVHNGFVEEMKTGNVFSSKLAEEETISHKDKAGFKLFGVLIQ